MTVATAVQFMTATSLMVMFTDCGGTMIPVLGNNCSNKNQKLTNCIIVW